MTKNQLEKLKELHENGCSDSDIEDFCTDNKVSCREAFLQIDIWNAPDCCKNCKHVSFFASMYPCTSCSRAHQKDYFEERT